MSRRNSHNSTWTADDVADLFDGVVDGEYIVLVGDDGVEWDGTILSRAKSYVTQAWDHDENYGNEPRYINVMSGEPAERYMEREAKVASDEEPKCKQCGESYPAHLGNYCAFCANDGKGGPKDAAAKYKAGYIDGFKDAQR